MRVLTWNIWWRFGPWQERQPAITRVLADQDADLVFLQEVFADPDDGDQLDVISPDGLLHRARSRRSDGTPYRFGNAVLSRWPIEREATIVLPDAEGGSSPRSAVIVQIAHPIGPLVAATTHLTWQYDQSRTRQAQLAHVLASVDAFRVSTPRSPWPVVFGGDLNAVPESDELRRLTGLAPPYVDGVVYTDCWAAVSDDPGYTWVRDNPHSADAQWPRRRIDHVCVSWPRPKPTGNPLEAWLVGTEECAGTVPSDHYGVAVTLDDRAPFHEVGR